MHHVIKRINFFIPVFFFLLTPFVILLHLKPAHDAIARAAHQWQSEFEEASLEDYETINEGVLSFLKTGDSTYLHGLSSQEVAHMRDVFFILNGIRSIWILCLALFMVFWLRADQKEFYRVLKTNAAHAFLLIPLGAGLLVALFDESFFAIHKILFANDFWLLDPAQHILIRAYPPLFFKVFFATWAISAFALYGALYIAVRRR